MKKIIPIIAIVLLTMTGCREHVYHTYYGDIDIDTMEVAYTRDGFDWYLVRSAEKDSFNWNGEWKYIYGPIKDYYCPANNLYEETFPDNQGNTIITEIDPYHQYDWLKDEEKNN